MWESLSEEERLKLQEAAAELDAAQQDMELYEKFQKPLDTKQKTADKVQAEVQRGIIPGQGGCPILQNTPCMHVTPGMRDATGQN